MQVQTDGQGTHDDHDDETAKFIAFSLFSLYLKIQGLRSSFKHEVEVSPVEWSFAYGDGVMEHVTMDQQAGLVKELHRREHRIVMIRMEILQQRLPASLSICLTYV